MASKSVKFGVSGDSELSILAIQKSDRASTRSSFQVDREVIVYDYVQRKLTRQPKENVDGMTVMPDLCTLKFIDEGAERQCLEVDLPGSKTRCDVYIQDKSSGVRTYFATVDLSQMSRSIAWKRRRGLIRKLYIVGQNPDEAMMRE